ncbi:MAG: tetratricopeptide repeat protein [Gammaproteobacteria bacterium]|nr:tetratricopeptide repeat protein [Gammaproteobacteria bacterium]MDH5629441.1 tetratricopeptide repeat protein [Gammaproteobacteria bacterium]
MSYETEEQQLERLKDWWKENGTSLIVGAVLGLSGFAGWKYWNEQKVQYQADASDLYNQIIAIQSSGDLKLFNEKVEDSRNQFPDSTYAILASFVQAKKAVETNELDKASESLNWIISNHADHDLAVVAKMRLARIYLQQDKANEALSLLDVTEDSGYFALANLTKGDAFMILNKKRDALLAYQEAAKDYELTMSNPALQLKIDELNGMIEKEVSEVIEQ